MSQLNEMFSGDVSKVDLDVYDETIPRELVMDYFVDRLKEAKLNEVFYVSQGNWSTAMPNALSQAQRFLGKRFMYKRVKDLDGRTKFQVIRRT